MNFIELEAAEALAGLAHFPTSKSPSNGSDCNSSFATVPSNSYEQATNFMVKGSEKSGVSTSKSLKDEESVKLGPTNCATSRKKSRHILTEAEMEARKIRRVLANRESARQTIRRRQAVFDELTRKAVDLAWENENLKREKDTASKHYDSLKTTNECLKAKMTKTINNEPEITPKESITTNEPTNSPVIVYNQPPSFLPFVWPSSVPLQCGSPAAIVFPSHTANDLNSSSCEGAQVYLLPYPWLVTLPQSNNENYPHSFSVNNEPRESFECRQFFPEKSTTNPPDDEEIHQEHHPKAGDDSKQTVEEIHQVPYVCSGKRLCDNVAATEARKRRKQLTREKNYFRCPQLRMH